MLVALSLCFLLFPDPNELKSDTLSLQYELPRPNLHSFISFHKLNEYLCFSEMLLCIFSKQIPKL